MIRTFLFALFALSLQANAAVVSFNPPSKTVNVGDIFTIGVEGSGFATDLDGGGLNLSFNPAVLQVLDVIIDGTAWDFLPSDGTIANAAGTVTETTFNQFAHPKVGAFSILEYQFQALAKGASMLQLTEFDGNPFASLGLPVTVTFTDGSVNVVPEPSTVSLLLAGLLVAFAMSRRIRMPR
jgi:PEP-CTERM motif